MAANPEPELTKRAQSLLKSNPTDFVNTCGTRYVSMEHRASAAGVVISITSVKQTWKQKFLSDVSGGYDGVAMSASASAKFSDELKSALTQHRVNFHVFATGGDGFGELGEMCKGLAKQDDPMDSLASGLPAFLKPSERKTQQFTRLQPLLWTNLDGTLHQTFLSPTKSCCSFPNTRG
jgi:hypothetical protein